MSAAPIIVTALMGVRDFQSLDALRRTHFPPERNHLRAHLTVFHHLPPSILPELLRVLQDEVRAGVPVARLAAPISLGRGVAFRIESDDLADIRRRLAERFAPMLTPQDASPWRPHITVQNKVSPSEARILFAELKVGFTPRPFELSGLAAWYYREGPWDPIAAFAFGTGRKIIPPV